MPVVAESTHRVPEAGDVVRLRTRTYLVESAEAGVGGNLIRMACLDDDAQGQPLEAIWELELDRKIVDDEEVWKTIGNRGFDPPRMLSLRPYAALALRHRDQSKSVPSAVSGWHPH
jgi:hypothetical protein